MTPFPHEPVGQTEPEGITQGSLDELSVRIQGLQQAAKEAKRREARCHLGQWLARSQLLYLVTARSLRAITTKVFDWRWPGS